MTIYYQFVSEDHLLLMRWTGLFSISHYRDSISKMQKNPNWQHLKRFFLDLRELEVSSNKIIVDQLLKIRKESIPGVYKTAYIVDNPFVLVNVHLYAEGTKSDDYKYFSTIKPAIDHLGLNYTTIGLEEMLNRLPNIF